ncbi:unnamed protein product [Owenia fusiformis]|uniref:Uncharacterized protein n=1 Tax=Owenia fusiformis TaxID=6347 RepID=A0A8J1U9S7_OWEFU|nr:unnamed protein product [Owenia fusiformis]
MSGTVSLNQNWTLAPKVRDQNGNDELNGFTSPLPRSGSIIVSHHSPEKISAMKKEGNRDNLYHIAAFYCLLMGLLGLVFPVTEALTNKWLKLDYVGGFNIYMSVVSIIVMLIIQFVLLREKKVKKKEVIATRRASRLGSIESSFKEIDPSDLGSQMTLHRHSITTTVSEEEIPFEQSKHGAGFYIRVGAIGFGLGKLLFNGLNLANLAGPECRNVVMSVDVGCGLLFTFLQTFFLFKNSGLCVYKYRNIVAFGLLHVLATNMCVWVRAIISEALETIEEHGHISDNSSSGHLYSSPEDSVMFVEAGGGGHSSVVTGCDRGKSIVDSVAPYLFPFIIEYSIIAAALSFRIFTNIGLAVKPSSESDGSERNHADHHPVENSVDCTKANKGIFAGLIIFILGVVGLIMYMVLLKEEQQYTNAIYAYYITEIGMLAILLVAVILAIYKLKELYVMALPDDIENALLVIGLVGLVANDLFGLMAAITSWDKAPVAHGLHLAESLLSSIQALAQIVFITDALRRRLGTKSHFLDKPGRGIVTFLIIGNVTLWITQSIQVKQAGVNEPEAEVFGHVAWAILDHITDPLRIFFRFHSSACLADIFSHTYSFHHDH